MDYKRRLDSLRQEMSRRGLKAYLTTADAVSYTHLDVYKRQV